MSAETTSAVEAPEASPAGPGCCGSGIQTPFESDRLSSLTEGLSVLGHPIRARILEILAADSQEVCVCDLQAALPVKQPTVSHHLKILRDAGLVGYRKRGQWAHYFLHRSAIADLTTQTRSWLDSLA